MEIKKELLEVESYSGQKIYVVFERISDNRKQCEFEYLGYHFCVTDTYRSEESVFCREIKGKRKTLTDERDGISFAETFMIGREGSRFRVGVPSAVYGEYIDENNHIYHSFMEDRLTGPMVVLYDEDKKESVAVQKIVPAKRIEKEQREKGDRIFLHKTETSSIGYGYAEMPYIKICWPYEEKEKSVAINSAEDSVKAFYPLDEEAFRICLEYRISNKCYETYTDALYSEYKKLAEILEEKGEQTVNLPFTREEGIRYRKDSVAKTYREFDEKGAGFFFHFDPKHGYKSKPSGFGTSFNTIPHETYTHILEYGFTGRQINIALEMAQDKKEYLHKAEKVIDFFVNECVENNGWVYSIYDVKDKRAVHSFGDPTAPRLHYMYYDRCKGNYLRTMTEPMNDLLSAYFWYLERGIKKELWLSAVEGFAGFLLNRQNKDGSWYRAYTNDGTPVFMNEREELSEKENDRGRKASTMIPVIFLCEMSKKFPEKKEYIESAKKAAEYTLEHEVSREVYQGGTMDNPNIVDKEAAQYVMAGMYHLYERTKEQRFLYGAVMAAKQFSTWNYIWNAPMREGNILHEKGFCTKGMGAINSIWCGGVVDIYSLFHIRELYLLGVEIKNEFFMKLANDISIATHQILSYPQDDMGFTDIGMQPEGFGICAQGMDEGMIVKGDIWGTLGWIYSAGIFGIERYLKEL